MQEKYKELTSGPIQITFRLPNGERMEYNFHQTDATKVNLILKLNASGSTF